MARSVMAFTFACLLLSSHQTVADSDNDASRLHGLIEKAMSERRFTDAERLARELRAHQEQRHGKELEVAESLDLLIKAIWAQDRYNDPEVRQLFVELVDLRKRLQGESSREYSRAFGGLNGLDMMLGRDIPSVCERARMDYEIQKRAMVLEPVELTEKLRQLGDCYWRLADHPRALAYSEQALRFWEQQDGMDSINRSTILHQMSRIKRDALHLDEAREMLQEVLRIREAKLPAGDQLIAYAHTALALVLRQDGDLVAARTHHEKAVALLEAKFGADTNQVAIPLVNLGDVLLDLGDFQGAQSLLGRAFEILNRSEGDAGRSLYPRTSLALTHLRMRDFEKATYLLQESRTIMEKSLGHSHFRLAEVLLHLGDALAGLGKIGESRAAYEDGIRILQSAKSWVHDDLLDRLADLDAEAGKYHSALRFYEQSISITEEALGSSHHKLAPSLAGKAWIQLKQGKISESIDNALRAEALTREHFTRMAGQLAEHEALRFEELRDSGLDLAIASLKLRSASISGRDAERVWDAVIRSRAMVLEEVAARQRAIVGSDPVAEAASARFVKTRRRLFRVLSAEEPSPKDAIQRIVEEAERAERELAALSQGFRQSRQRLGAGLREVLTALPPDAALIAYVRHHEPRSPRGEKPGAPLYMAFIASASRPPAAVHLGGADVIDHMINSWRREAASRPEGLDSDGSQRNRLAETGRRLRAALWDPVSRFAQGRRLVLIVPDGPINLVNFGALPADDRRYLVEHPALHHYLAAERDVIRPKDKVPAEETLLAMGGPVFDEVGDAAAASSAKAVYRGPASTCSDFRSMRFEPLPAARAEVEELGTVWMRSGRKAKTLVGAAATEESFKTLAPGARVVHVASHGFFLSGSCWPGARTDDQSESRLLLSGLALAGANQRNALAKEAGERDDGVLTADEIGALDLSGADWVVLSACETGTGLVRAGEGVLGLRRAFEAAGAGSLIMSLWAVEDSATRRWMRNLYEARVAGADTAAAVRQASLRTMEADRRAGRSTHPFYWAGFVAAGDWK